MPELKRTFLKGRMNKDLDERLLPNGEYFDATNIQVNTSEDSDVGAIESILGNTQQLKRNSSNDLWTAGFGLTSPQCIGGVRDTQNNKIYWFITGTLSSNPANAILEYDEATDIVSVIIADIRATASQVLNFNTSNPITGINIIDGLLFFTDNLNEPRRINIATFKDSPTNTGTSVATIDATTTLLSKKSNSQIAFIAEDINVIKKSPKRAATLDLNSSLLLPFDVPGIGRTPLKTKAINFRTSGVLDFGSTTLNFTGNIDSVNYVLNQRTILLKAEIKNEKGIIQKYTISGTVTAFTSTTLTFTPLILPEDLPDKEISYDLLAKEEDYIYKRSFPRFSYRWKYNDGEFSAFAPFTPPAFLPGIYKYEGINAENEAMLNHVRKITLNFFTRETTFGPPRDVQFVEVLYKASNSNNIHVIKTIELLANPDAIDQGEFLKFEITEELDGPVIDSSQMLRLFDAVPKKALAQEIIGNRIVYGNYTEGNDTASEISFATGLNNTSNFSFNTSLPQLRQGSLSVKSDRAYQIGVSFLDDFNRESPVITNTNAVLSVTKERSHLLNFIQSRVLTTAPSWAKFFKYYVKDTYADSHNLLLDRFYNAEDGNMWLSFPSAERNKVETKDILVLKKRHGNATPVNDDNEYKIIDVQNEAPEYLRRNNLAVGARAKCSPQGNSNPIIAAVGDREANFVGPSSTLNEAFVEATRTARFVQFVSGNSNSKIYELESIGIGYSAISANQTNYKMILAEDLEASDTFITGIDDASSGNFVEIKLFNSDQFLTGEFNGRFFVKVEKLGSFHKDIIAPSNRLTDVGNTFVTQRTNRDAVATIQPVITSGQTSLTSSVLNPTTYNSFSNHLPASPQQETLRILYKTYPTSAQLDPVFHVEEEDVTIAKIGFDIDTHTMSPTSEDPRAASTFTLIYGPTNAEINEVSDVFDAMVQKARFCFVNSNDTKSHSYIISSVGATQTQTLGGFVYAAKQITLDRTYSTSNMAAADIDGILVLEENLGTILVSNPAIFETKSEKNIDLDIYYEASDAIEISQLANNITLSYRNCVAFGNGVESTRISDAFNANLLSKGVRVSSTLKKEFKEETRQSDLIFSGIINSRTDINNSNQFLIAENITKTLNPIHGSIQKLHARDTDLIVLCEDKCFRILANKDALFNADGNANVTSNTNVLGQAVPYVGEYGISKNPESFASFGFRVYFTDKARGAVIRLSRDGITVISDQGMSDFIQDSMDATTDSLNGSYDEAAGTYNLRIGSEQISYDENSKGWATRLTYQPEFALSLNSQYYSFNAGSMWKHINTTRANFYGSQQNTTATVIFNDSPSLIKNFKTIFYEGDSGWTADLETDKQTGITNVTLNPDLKSSNAARLFEKEGKYYNFISGDSLTWSNALSDSGGTQTGNLDTAEFAVQGIGIIRSESNNGDYATADPVINFGAGITFSNSMQAKGTGSLPVSTGDQFFYVNNSSSKIYKLGEITAIDRSAGTITVNKQSSDVPPVLPTASGGDFAFFVKDTSVNKSGILGYFNKATFTNTGTGKNELFAVGTEAFISS